MLKSNFNKTSLTGDQRRAKVLDQSGSNTVSRHQKMGWKHALQTFMQSCSQAANSCFSTI